VVDHLSRIAQYLPDLDTFAELALSTLSGSVDHPLGSIAPTDCSGVTPQARRRVHPKERRRRMLMCGQDCMN
jgi:hypothetical protein